MKPSPLKRLIVLSAFAGLGATHSLTAGILYWDGTDTNANANGGAGTWDTTTANWDTLATAGANATWPTSGTDNDANFSGSAGGAVTIATGGVTANDITFGVTGYTIGGAGLTLNGTLPVLTVNSPTATINSSITSAVAGGFSKAGIGTLVLGGANSFAANTTMVFGVAGLNHGNILLTNSSALSGITLINNHAVTNNATAQIQLQGGITVTGTNIDTGGRTDGTPTSTVHRTTGALLVNNSGNNEWGGFIRITNVGGTYGIRSDAGTLTLSGGLRSNHAADRIWDIGGTGDVLISGVIGGATSSAFSSTMGLTKFGSGTLTISGSANTFGGPTRSTAGTILLTNALALVNSTVDMTAGDTGLVRFGPSLTTATFGALTGSRNLSLLNINGTPAAVTLSVGNASATSYAYTGVLSGGNLYKIGAGAGTFTLDPGTGVSVSINSLSANAGGAMILKSGNIGTTGIDPFNNGYVMGAGVRGGTLTVDGAALTVGGSRRFVIGAAANGTGNLVSGSLTANEVLIGHNGTTTMTQSGGTLTTNNLYHQDAGGGTYTLTGGTLIAQSIYNNTNSTPTFTLNLNGGTLQARTGTTNLIRTQNTGTQISVLLGTGNTQIDTSQSSATIARPMGNMSGQAGTFTKIGANTLTLTEANTYTGATKISGGTLALGATGSITSPNIIVGASTTFDVSGVTGGYTLGAAQTLSGTGSVVGATVVAGTLSPGNSPGSMSVGSQTWVNGGDYNWQILDTTGLAGTGFDTIAMTGTLNLSSLTAGGFSINLWSLASISPDVNGNALNFDNTLNQSWNLLTASVAIIGFDAADFVINTGAANGTGGFGNSLGGGAFTLGTSGNSLVLNFTAIPEPSAAALLGGLGMLGLLRRRRQLKPAPPLSEFMRSFQNPDKSSDQTHQ